MNTTPWFDGTVKPARPGVYERYVNRGIRSFSRWDGIKWFGYCSTSARAEQTRYISAHQDDLKWRGLDYHEAKRQRTA